MMIEPCRFEGRGRRERLGHRVEAHVAALTSRAPQQLVERLVGQAGPVEAGAPHASDALLFADAQDSIVRTQRDARVTGHTSETGIQIHRWFFR